jgi:hypothetical protein
LASKVFHRGPRFISFTKLEDIKGQLAGDMAELAQYLDVPTPVQK